MKGTMFWRNPMIEFYAEETLYQTHTCITCLLFSQSSPLGTTLLKLPSHHTFRLSILLLISHRWLSILLLNESAESRFFKAFTNFINSHNSRFQLATNIQSRQKRVAVRLLPTAIFKSPKSAFSTTIM
jgi:hypothetical protein